MTLLAIETSCDETSAAVVRNHSILANVVASQMRLHEEYGGVVPELATREHLRNLMPVVREAYAKAGVTSGDIDAFAATQGPGLPSALMIGFQAAQAAAFATEKPFVGVHHHEAHLYSPWIREQRAVWEQFQPNVSLIVSGGHTLLVHVRAPFDHAVLGGTVDDAAGECFDKAAKLIGLPYPGGPEIDNLAQAGNPEAHKFPRPLLHDANDDFSFSGLKTAIRYFLRDHPEAAGNAASTADLCASIQAAIVEVLTRKTLKAAKRLGVRCVTASGGVSCNRGLRQSLAKACSNEGMELLLADKKFCTDNAAMIGMIAAMKIERGEQSADYSQEVRPGWSLAN